MKLSFFIPATKAPRRLIVKGLLSALTALLMSSCSTIYDINAQKKIIDSELHEQTPKTLEQAEQYLDYTTEEVLEAFSKREGQFTIAISSFEDLSGSRIEGGASTAVAGSGQLLLEYILKGYSDLNFMRLHTRRLLTDLVNERRLAQQANQSNAAQSLESLSEATRALINSRITPLYQIPDINPVDFLVTGAVIGYDKNVLDTGAGAGIVGINSTYRKSSDSVSVLVQLVNVRSGAIVGVGVGNQAVESMMTNSGVFKFLEVDQILELEGGGSINEPKTYALFAALTEAVEDMFRDAL